MVTTFVYLGMFIQPFVKNSLLVITRILASINQPQPQQTAEGGLGLDTCRRQLLWCSGRKKFSTEWLVNLSNASNQVLPSFFMRIPQYRNSHSGNANYPTRIMDRIGWIFLVAHFAMIRLLTCVCIQNIFNSRWFTTLENWQLTWNSVISIEMLI